MIPPMIGTVLIPYGSYVTLISFNLILVYFDLTYVLVIKRKWYFNPNVVLNFVYFTEL